VDAITKRLRQHQAQDIRSFSARHFPCGSARWNAMHRLLRRKGWRPRVWAELEAANATGSEQEPRLGFMVHPPSR
jgi:hypothetical protein